MGVISFGIDFIFMCNRCSSIDFIDIYDKKKCFSDIYLFISHKKKKFTTLRKPKMSSPYNKFISL